MFTTKLKALAGLVLGAAMLAGVGTVGLLREGRATEHLAAGQAKTQAGPGPDQKGHAGTRKNGKQNEERKFDLVRWKEGEKGELPELQLVLTRPKTTYEERADLLAQYAKAAVREARQHEGKKFNVVFLLREKDDADERLMCGVGLESLRELSRADPEQAQWLATWRAWWQGPEPFRDRLKECAEATKEAKADEGTKFDLVRWQEKGKSGLPELVLVLTKPDTTHGKRGGLVALYAKAALREAERRQGTNFNIIFLVRETDEAEQGLATGLGLEELREISRAEPQQAGWLVTWHMLWGNGWTIPPVAQTPKTKDADVQQASSQGQGGEAKKGAASLRLPTGPIPVQAIVSLDKEGRLVVVTSVITHEPTVKPGGNVGKAKKVERAMTVRYPLKDVQAYDTRGVRIGIEKLRGRVAVETIAYVFFAPADAPPIDPLHLRLCREGTLVFVVPPAEWDDIPGPDNARPSRPRD